MIMRYINYMIQTQKTKFENRDFTLKKYEELCKFLINNDYKFFTVRDYLKTGNIRISDKAVVMRHDIDRNFSSSLKIAELENKLGIKTSYYFRYPYTYNIGGISKIASLGHEIGYHYEVLSKAKCSLERAIRIFDDELKTMRDSFDIETICMHGSPLSKCDNRMIWKHYNISDFGLLGDASIDILKPIYFNDTGRNWNDRFNIRDNVGNNMYDPILNSTDDLILFFKNSSSPQIYISTHPERWSNNWSEWAISYIKDLLYNYGKIILYKFNNLY